MRLVFLFVLFVQVAAFAESESRSSSSGSNWKFGIGAGDSPVFLATLKGTQTDSGGTTDTEFSIHAWHVPQNSWAFISGFQYSGERELKKATINGMTATSINSPAKYQVHNLYVGTAYRWESFYIPLALN